MLSYRDTAGRATLAAMVLGSGMAFLDGTVVNIALPAIGNDLGGGAAALQWTVNAYALTLAALILLGGALGDAHGRRRVFTIGVVWFAVASLACGLAPDVATLVVARALQGVGGALLTPGALAILQASFAPGDRARAIGAWSGLTGVASAIGPFVGGWLVEHVSWRGVFLINLPLALVVVWLTHRYVPESSDPDASPRLDGAGAALGAVGLGALTYGLIHWSDAGAGAAVWVTVGVGAALLAAFVAWEAHAPAPMLPLALFRRRAFSAVNAVTFALYAALSGVLFFLVIALQVVVGLTPLESGVALVPVTVLMLILSSHAGALGQKIGPRIPMTVGTLACAASFAWLAGVDAHSTYVRDVLGPVLLMGLGLSAAVAPLTATALSSAAARHAGAASGVNNAVARVGGLLAVAVLPLAAGVGPSLTDPVRLASAFPPAMLMCAGLALLSAVLSAAFIPGREADDDTAR